MSFGGSSLAYADISEAWGFQPPVKKKGGKRRKADVCRLMATADGTDDAEDGLQLNLDSLSSSGGEVRSHFEQMRAPALPRSLRQSKQAEIDVGAVEPEREVVVEQAAAATHDDEMWTLGLYILSGVFLILILNQFVELGKSLK
jgi:hypothetical protein